MLLISTPTGAIAAGPPSPFVGHWQATDIDGSQLGLTIGGPPSGPFQITLTDSYLSYCDGGPGLVRGSGTILDGEPPSVVADLLVECLAIHRSMAYQLVFTYLQATDTLLSDDGSAFRVVYRHPGQPQLLPEHLRLKVNYQDNWVEGFYEEGHKVWLTVTASDGVEAKATAEVLTEDWGFGTEPYPDNWSPEPPDIEPGDWVYAWVDNGASAQMRVGEIFPTVDLLADTVTVAIWTDWFGEEEVYVHCSIWGHDEGASGMVVPDGASEFICSFDEMVDIVAGDVAEIVYYGPDEHGVNYYLYIPDPHFTVFPEWEWFDGYDWPDGSVDVTVAGKSACTTSGDSSEGFFNGGFPGECDLTVEDEVTFSDGTTTRTHTVRELAVLGVDEGENTVAGTAEAGAEIVIWVHEHGESEMSVSADGGAWLADFDDVGFPLEAGTCGRVEIRDNQGNATAVDWCVPNTRFTIFPEWNYLEGYEWPDGAVVSVIVTAKEACSASATAGYPDWDPWNTFFSVDLPGDCTLEDGDQVTLSTDGLRRTHEVQMLAVTQVNMEADTVSGIAEFDPEQYTLHTWIHEVDDSYMELTLEDGTWEADFSRVGLTLEFGMGGRVEVVDEGSNATAVDWNTPPAMGLRVNYGHDWVESFYEGDHEVSLKVTEADRETVKATATAYTEPKEYWGYESGFTTWETGWDGEAPDLQPGDWVFAVVDNGVTAEVQLGEIRGEVLIFEDRISGRIYAPWIDDPVDVECLDWGSGLEEPINKDAGSVMPNGSDEYGCSWDPETEWDIDAWQDIGVGYSTPDGHWVANAFHAEHWVGLYTHDLQLYWSQGDYTYYFAHSYSAPFDGGGASDSIGMTISSTLPDGSPTPPYPGEVLLQYWAQQAWTGAACEPVDVIHPDQPTRFVWGWMTDTSMPWEEALAHFDSLSVTAYWESGATDGSQDLERVSLVRSDEYGGVCSLTGASE
jgi:hypothetical protein